MCLVGFFLRVSAAFRLSFLLLCPPPSQEAAPFIPSGIFKASTNRQKSKIVTQGKQACRGREGGGVAGVRGVAGRLGELLNLIHVIAVLCNTECHTIHQRILPMWLILSDT